MDIKKILNEMTLREKAEMCSGKDFWHLQGIPRLGIPSIMATDGPHGIRKQKGDSDHLGLNESVISICFPTSSALAASFDRELLKEVGSILGRECQGEKVGILLGPGVNIKRSPLCGRNFEYYSEDPFLSSELSSAYIIGLQNEGIACSVKHYLANNQETERMCSDSVVDERTLNEIYLASFEGGIKKAKAKTVMCSYNKINGVYAAENKELLTDVLRGKWGFDGFVVTDWGAVKDKIVGLKAGLELMMPGGNSENTEEIIQAVENGDLEEETLNIAVGRILSVIDFILSNKKTNVIIDHEADHAKACDVATECAVLLKNENKLLPLNKSSKIVFIGEFAKNPRYQGNGSSYINSYKVDNALEAVIENVEHVRGYDLSTDEIDKKLIEEAKQKAMNAEVAVIFAGLPNTYESEGFDRKHMRLPTNQNILIEEICKVQKNTVVVLYNGSSVEMPWVNKVNSILEMYLAGEAVGSATVKLLFGDAVPSGKLAETFPVKLSDNPSYLNFPGYMSKVEYREGVYVGYRYYDTKEMEVLFPFGHGLSYTDFVYDNLETDKIKIQDTDDVNVSVTIKNIGDIVAKEVVQLYIKPLGGKVPRPIHELKGFEKVELEPGESKQVSFCLGKRAFAYYNNQIHDWHVESGMFEIQLGTSSRDIRLKTEIEVVSTVEIPMIFTEYSSVGQVLELEKGRNILGPIMQEMQKQTEKSKDASNEAMGDANEEMMKAMMMQMPLQVLVTFGMLPKYKLDEIITELNKR